jgi:FtsP/CotA-like multicopper oxidase with cupredoxin domain
MLTRRQIIKGGVWAPALLSASRAAAQDIEDIVLEPSPHVEPFTRRLAIPRPHLPLNRVGATPQERARATEIFNQARAEGRFKHGEIPPDGQADYYDVVLRPGVADIIPGLPTPIRSYNGIYPGATFIAERKRTNVVRFINRLDPAEICSTHYHGGHTPPDSDGTPMRSYSRLDRFSDIGPEGSRTHVYPNDNDFSATQWYHDHGEDCTAENVYRGLAGFYLLNPSQSLEEDAAIRAVEAQLPSGYGRYDIPMVFQDRQFSADGSLNYNNFDHDGFIGDRFLVNGVIQPYLPVANRKYRFRWLNGSNARQYEFFLSSGDKFVVIGSDGALLPQPVDVQSLRVTPAERYEVVIDFSRYPVGSKVYLLNCLQQTSGRKPDEEDVTMDACTQIVEFRIVREEDDPSTIPVDLQPAVAAYIRDHLTERPGLQVQNSVWDFERGNGAWQINDRFFDPHRVDLVEQLYTHSTWTLRNESGGWSHPIHVHDEEFAIVSRNGRPPKPYEAGLKDTFVLNPHDVVRIAAYWTGLQNVGLYVFHCHNMEHEDMRMMGVFEVVR